MEIKWHKISEEKPEKGKRIFISDREEIGLAAFLDFGGNGWWQPRGFSGYEWEWDFEPTHWAEIPEGFLPGKETP